VLVESALEGRRGLERFLRVWQESVTKAIQEGRRDAVLRQLWVVANMAMDHEESRCREPGLVRSTTEIDVWRELWTELLALLRALGRSDGQSRRMAQRLRERLEVSCNTANWVMSQFDRAITGIRW